MASGDTYLSTRHIRIALIYFLRLKILASNNVTGPFQLFVLSKTTGPLKPGHAPVFAIIAAKVFIGLTMMGKPHLDRIPFQDRAGLPYRHRT